MSMTNIYFKDGKAEGLAEGEAKGKAEGIAEGKTEGELEMATLFLGSKFGELSPEHLKQLKKLSGKDLLAISDRIFSDQSIDDILPNTKH